MKPFLRFVAVIVCLLLIAASVIYHLGGKQMEFKAEVTINNTTVSKVMNHLTDPELAQQWIYGLQDLQTDNGQKQGAADSILDNGSADESTATFVDQSGTIEMKNECLFVSDDTLTTRSSNQHSDNFSTWQLTQQGDNVEVRQLMLGTHKGLGRFEGIFRKKKAQSSIELDLLRLKSFIETGKIPSTLVPTKEVSDGTGSRKPNTSDLNQNPNDDSEDEASSNEESTVSDATKNEANNNQ